MVIVWFCVEKTGDPFKYQVYEAPATIVDVKSICWPTHTGLVAVIVGVSGLSIIVTSTVAGSLSQPPSLITSVYVPASSCVAGSIIGFCPVSTFVPGASCVQVYDVAEAFVLNWIISPSQTSEIRSTAGVLGLLSTTNSIDVATLGQPSTVTINS